MFFLFQLVSGQSTCLLLCSPPVHLYLTTSATATASHLLATWPWWLTCGQIEEREWDRKWEWRTGRSTYRALQTALLISSSLVKYSLRLNENALNSFYEFSITPKSDKADKSPDRHKSISSRSHSLQAGRDVSIATGEIRRRNNRERWMKEQVRDEARMIDQSVEGVQGMGGGWGDTPIYLISMDFNFLA